MVAKSFFCSKIFFSFVGFVTFVILATIKVIRRKKGGYR